MKSVRTCGKFIIAGEHAVVYGRPAIASALQNFYLDVSVDDIPVKSWEESWSVTSFGEPLEPTSGEVNKLTQVWKRALQLLGADSFSPRGINVEFMIPFGAGLGASASVSCAFIRILSQILNKKLSDKELLDWPRALEENFHFYSSGLDVAAINSNGVILFSKESGTTKVCLPTKFKAVLVDTGERSYTSSMVAHVRQMLDQHKSHVELLLDEIGIKVNKILECTSIGLFGNLISETNDILCRLGLSTKKLEHVISLLNKLGAYGSKMTGSGGGGFVFGVFGLEQNTDDVIEELRCAGYKAYVNEVR